MRVSFSKVHRAFPELDGFTDAECAALIHAVQRERAVGLLATSMAAVVLSIASGLLAAYFTWRLLIAIYDVPDDRPTSDGLFVLFFSLIGGAGILTMALVGFLIRDLWLRWAIGRRLRLARCTGCNYSLLGLSVLDGRVRCPECGHVTRLSDRGLQPADILAGAHHLILKDGVA